MRYNFAVAEEEGVTKFHLAYRETRPLDWELLRDLNAWRKRLHDVGLIGRDPRRYGGVGFGNVSRRLSDGRFAVTGTQTSHLPDLNAGHYAVVLESHPDDNRLVAEGPIAPSSEAMTHGMIYALRPAVQFVMHVHAPVLWKNTRRLGLATTDPSAAYGTPEMTAEVKRLFAAPHFGQQGVFVMGGHEDGVVSFGRTLEEAGEPLLQLHEKASRL